ncbi:MAG: bifunctional DNA-formamidopyrimidine glycosylase/DNA-(apurinic or apyrimidinic site) lyase [Candidatus Zixiibacteriota bacterium]
MPELPEVETVARGLRALVIGREIVDTRLLGVKLRRINPRNFKSRVTGRRFINVRRRGKNLLLDLSDDLSLWAHLKMTGRFVESQGHTGIDRHDHLIMELGPAGKRAKTRLVFRDVRKFGFVKLAQTSKLMEQQSLQTLGPEPLEISRDEFVRLISERRRAIKPALLDQTLIAGLGNIYTDEALFAARIHPRALTCEISSRKLGALHEEVQRVLTLAINRMGTTFDSYSGVNGEPGRFQKYLKVYGRENESCTRCGRKITRLVIGQRSAHFCSRCQRR